MLLLVYFSLFFSSPWVNGLVVNYRQSKVDRKLADKSATVRGEHQRARLYFESTDNIDSDA